MNLARKYLFLALSIGLFSSSLAHGAEVVELCNVTVQSQEKIDFSGVEEAWLCGSKDQTAWTKVPLSQKKLFLKGFLQDRGYHNPAFEEKNGRLLVDAGEPERVKNFTVTGAPKEFDPSKRRLLKGKILNGSALDDASNWTKRQLQYMGYPCPKVKPFGITDRQEVRLFVKPGPKTDFSILVPSANKVKDVNPGVLDRYTAFSAKQPFDVRLLELTSTRIMADNLYMSSYYDVLCPEEGEPQIIRRFVAAKPRVLTVGVGYDSQLGVVSKVSFNWSRIDTPANQLESSLLANFRIQTLTGTFHYHISPNVSPNFELAPNVTVTHDDEVAYNTLQTTAGVNAGYLWEFFNWQLKASAGPAFNYVKTYRGAGPANLDAPRLITNFVGTSHLFEYYANEPRTGWMFSLNTQSQSQSVFASQTFHRILIKHQMLWNLGHFDPPAFVFGWRGSVGTYLFNHLNEAPRDVPVLERFFLGGDDDLRGFGRQRLPGDGNGYVTALYEGFELRMGTWFPINIQPFLFLDLAKVGQESLQLNNSLFYSPGVGLRYASPFGSVRATFGHGYAVNPMPTDPATSWQFFINIGKEF